MLAICDSLNMVSCERPVGEVAQPVSRAKGKSKVKARTVKEHRKPEMNLGIIESWS
ncbi:hypothetical protein ADINL_1970 [Nitrincola lacisaponensis]|uniref:Uncharacterized protein n=1 Tax=Nitrincola lacisaponensis TaxID=267850 RepID=A0A063Y450_9GAMM|nr:hypothetical protein ADINL_1970 [Nitrincola lacisaponensis]